MTLKEYAAAFAQDIDALMPEKGEGGASDRVKKFTEEMLKEEWGGKKETATMKLMATAGAIAKKKGAELPKGLSTSNPLETAINIFDAVGAIKGAFQTAKGLMETDSVLDRRAKGAVAKAEAVANKTIDGVARVAKEAADTAVDMAVEKGVDVVMGTVVSVFPPAAALAPYAKIMARAMASPVKEKVREGITKVTNSAKRIVASIGAKARSVWSVAKSFVKSWF